jgi:acetolactate synthase-1/2/3 large subunit
VPGGGSSLQVIAAAEARGIAFVLTRTESAALMMAAVTGELTGVPGVALTTKGPGLANGINGLAYAALDRAPMLLLADGFDAAGLAYQSHQVMDQAALVAPLVKGHSRLRGADAGAELAALLDLAMQHPRGPVYVEFTAAHGKKPAAAHRPRPAAAAPPAPAPAALDAARALLARHRRPVLVPGLEVIRDPAHAAAFRDLARALRCPVFPTYKAKGILPDDDPLVVGLYVGGAGEAPFVARSDLIVLVGADPVEFALQPWRAGDIPVLELAMHDYERRYVTPAVTVSGDLGAALAALAAGAAASDWDAADVAAMQRALADKLRISGNQPITPQQVIDAAVAVAPSDARISVDAGAHMLPVMAFWRARAEGDVLISNGSATMAFSLPAAIAAALEDPARPVIAFIGDGGLSMCLGELATAAQQRANITVVVFNDSTLSMIGIKQTRSGYASAGVDFSRIDFAAAAAGLGCLGLSCTRLEQLEGALRQGLAHDGPAVVDVTVDPAGYMDQVKALRG